MNKFKYTFTLKKQDSYSNSLYPRKILQNLPYFWNMKTKNGFFFSPTWVLMLQQILKQILFWITHPTRLLGALSKRDRRLRTRKELDTHSIIIYSSQKIVMMLFDLG